MVADVAGRRRHVEQPVDSTALVVAGRVHREMRRAGEIVASQVRDLEIRIGIGFAIALARISRSLTVVTV
jgi:hypothetical protein